MWFSKLSLLTSYCLVMPAFRNVLDPKNYDPADIIVADVAIIGGGSSGTYAAINLREMGQNVVVVEKKKHLGGHTNTYRDHSTNVTIDYGVQAFLNSSITRDYFAHFGVPVVNYTGSNNIFLLADFNTGKPLTINPSRDLTGWATQLAKYPWLDSTWNVPQPVAADLWLPLRDFLTKYNLSDVAFAIYFGAQGLSNPLQQSTIDVMKMVDPAYLFEMTGSSLGTAHQNNAEIYLKALAELGSNALIHSGVTAATRTEKGNVSLAVKTRKGAKLVQASKVLITIPPTLENMKPFDLNPEERRLFSQWDYKGYYTVLLNNTGLPSGYQWINANYSAVTYNIPQQPSASQITSTRIPGIFYVWYRSPSEMTREDVEKAVILAIQNIQTAQNLTVTTPHILKFKSHTPFKLSVPAQAIRDGFYSNLYSLQGKRSTWYTGAAFIAHNSGLVWNFTHGLLPQIASD
jgi:hypothetical protein